MKQTRLININEMCIVGRYLLNVQMGLLGYLDRAAIEMVRGFKHKILKNKY